MCIPGIEHLSNCHGEWQFLIAFLVGGLAFMKLMWTNLVTKFFYVKEYIRNILIGFGILKRSKKEESEILSKFIDAVNEHGEKSEDVKFFFYYHKKEKNLIDLFNASLKFKEFLTLSKLNTKELKNEKSTDL